MGQVQSTYSYRSRADAESEMFAQLAHSNIPVCMGKHDPRYFIFDRRRERRYIRCDRRTDCRGIPIYECWLEPPHTSHKL